jgi:acyl carrier protein
VAGELYIAGDGLARGYINNPELTAEKFVTNSHITGERMYRTGDLAGFRPAGSIEFLGRLDKQVKIRGFRIELGEIENILLNHEQVKEAVVIAGNKKNDKYLCAYYVAEDKKQGAATGPAQNTNAKDSPGHTELRAYVSFRLPPYMIPSYFVQIEKMPLTANGKINRKALPEPDQPVGAAYIAPRNISEETLTQIWADVLGIEKDKLSIDGNFFELGGHSLKAAMLTARIHKKMGLKIPLDQVFINPTVMGLAESFKNTRGAEFASAQPVEKKEYYDCTYVQERFYILQQMDVASTVYNLTGIYLCEGDLEAKKLAGIFLRLIGRHDILRTSFKTVAARPVQVVHQNGAFAVDYYEKSDEDATGTIKNFIRPFDLTEAPLLRVGIERLSPGKTLLMTDVHHIIADGLSLSILMGEFFNLYNGKDAPPLKLQYKDFAAWQKNYFKTGIIKKQETFWLEKFSGEIPVLKLPLDRPRGQAMDFQGGSHKFKFDKELTAGIKNLTRQRNATLFMTLFAAYNVLLARLSRQEDIIVGVPAAGRNYPDLENIIGLFLNTLILRSNPAFAKTFGEFLEEVRQNALAVFENQDYQFEMLLKKIDIKREAGRNQLFDSVFDLQNYADTMQFPETGRSGLKFTPYEYENKTAKYDMTLYIYETGDEITLNCTYRTCLFEPATIAYIMGEYHRLMGQIVKAPGMPLGDYEIFSRKHL